MMSYAIVFLGAGIGGALRHGTNIWCARLLGTSFPWGTFLVNIGGSLAMGLLAGWFIFKGDPGHWRLFLATGVLGGFTTFSAFSLDALLLIERGQAAAATLYIGGSVVGSIAGLFVGLWAMRTLHA